MTAQVIKLPARRWSSGGLVEAGRSGTLRVAPVSAVNCLPLWCRCFKGLFPVDLSKALHEPTKPCFAGLRSFSSNHHVLASAEHPVDYPFVAPTSTDAAR
jgi:hypothetical protein